MEKQELYQLIINSSAMNEKTAGELKEITEKFPWFSLAWILYVKNLKEIHSPEYESVLKSVAVRVSNRKLLHRFLNTEKWNHPLAIEFENSMPVFEINEEIESTGDSLIDKFLASNPRAIRRKTTEENSTETAERIDVAEKSTTESDELITETLANIYFQQKNYEKALNAYQKLSLKYPEKSVYFATRIKEIEDLKNIN